MDTYSYDPKKDPAFQLFIKELEKESDRGIAIICHAYIEDLLKELLKKRLIDDKRFHKSLEDRVSFHNILSFCYLTGIVTDKERKDIEYLSKIRNSFAHKRTIISFDHANIHDLCDKLIIPKSPQGKTTSRKKFVSTAAYYVQILNLKMKYVKQVKNICDSDSGGRFLISRKDDPGRTIGKRGGGRTPGRSRTRF